MAGTDSVLPSTKIGRNKLSEHVPCGKGYLATKAPYQGKAKASRSTNSVQGLEELYEYRKPCLLETKNPQDSTLENTYQLAPDPDKRFSPAKVRPVAQSVLDEMLTDVEYDPKTCRQLSLDIGDEIIRRVKTFGFDRYKIVCLTTIGQRKEQTIRIGSRCCWDEKVDSFLETTFMNRGLFAVTTVYGLYQE